jgi:hypothetical protein
MCPELPNIYISQDMIAVLELCGQKLSIEADGNI